MRLARASSSAYETDVPPETIAGVSGAAAARASNRSWTSAGRPSVDVSLLVHERELDVELVYDPDSDRPRITEVRGARLPLLPTFGLRYRF